jgi:DNA-binding NarL/FixJ family response regulator
VSESPQERIRLLLLDDEALFRAGLALYLAAQPGFEVVCECGSDAAALEILTTSRIDVVLLDFERGTQAEDGFMTAARRAGYQGRFLIVAAAADARSSAIAIKLGASGIFLKSEAPDRMAQAIRLVADGAAWLDQKVIQGLADQLIDRLPEAHDRRAGNVLTEREHKVLLGVMGGLTNKKIGDRIGVSEGSVKASLQQLFSRAGVRTRSQLVRIALEGSLGSMTGVGDRRRRGDRASVLWAGKRPSG